MCGNNMFENDGWNFFLQKYRISITMAPRKSKKYSLKKALVEEDKDLSDFDTYRQFTPICQDYEQKQESNTIFSKKKSIEILQCYTQMLMSIGDWNSPNRVRSSDFMEKLKQKSGKMYGMEKGIQLKWIIRLLNLLRIDHESTFYKIDGKNGKNQHLDVGLQKSRLSVCILSHQEIVEKLGNQIVHLLNNIKISINRGALNKISGGQSKTQYQIKQEFLTIWTQNTQMIVDDTNPYFQAEQEVDQNNIQLYQMGKATIIYRVPQCFICKLQNYIKQMENQKITSFIACTLGLTLHACDQDGIVVHPTIKRSIHKLLPHLTLHSLSKGSKIKFQKSKLYLVYEGKVLLQYFQKKQQLKDSIQWEDIGNVSVNQQKTLKMYNLNKSQQKLIKCGEIILQKNGLVLWRKLSDKAFQKNPICQCEGISMSTFLNDWPLKSTLLIKVDWKYIQSYFKPTTVQEQLIWETIQEKIYTNMCLRAQISKKMDTYTIYESSKRQNNIECIKGSYFKFKMLGNKKEPHKGQKKIKNKKVNEISKCITELDEQKNEEQGKKQQRNSEYFHIKYSNCRSQQASSQKNRNSVNSIPIMEEQLRNISKFMSNFPYQKMIQSYDIIKSEKNKGKVQQIHRKSINELKNIKKFNKSRMSFNMRQRIKEEEYNRQINRLRRLKIKNIAEKSIPNGHRKDFDVNGVEKILNENSLFSINGGLQYEGRKTFSQKGLLIQFPLKGTCSSVQKKIKQMGRLIGSKNSRHVQYRKQNESRKSSDRTGKSVISKRKNKVDDFDGQVNGNSITILQSKYEGNQDMISMKGISSYIGKQNRKRPTTSSLLRK